MSTAYDEQLLSKLRIGFSRLKEMTHGVEGKYPLFMKITAIISKIDGQFTNDVYDEYV